MEFSNLADIVQQLQISEENYHRLFETIDDIFLVGDLDG